jgi:hypothetical protein
MSLKSSFGVSKNSNITKNHFLSAISTPNSQNLSFSQLHTTLNTWDQCKGCPSTQKILQNIPKR